MPRSSLAWLLCIAALSASAGEIPLAERRSGYELMSRETRAMQDDDTANPGMLWVLEGETLWNRKTGGRDQSCADCHGEAGVSMKGVAARYPAFVISEGRMLNIEQRINVCRTNRQRAPALDYEDRELLALTAYVAWQSRGLPIHIAWTEQNRPYIDAGRAFFQSRIGQLNIACSQCHDDNWGKHLGGSNIPQAHPTGYPLYRLEWQGLGSLQRRLRSCMTSMRAEPYAYGAPELVNLELYLMWRARGMLVETPAVRP